jgi:hypothetical protein
MTDRELVPRPAKDDRTLIAEALATCGSDPYGPWVDEGQASAMTDRVLAALAAAGRHPDEIGRLRQALSYIGADLTLTPMGCPEPWRRQLIDYAQVVNEALGGAEAEERP